MSTRPQGCYPPRTVHPAPSRRRPAALAAACALSLLLTIGEEDAAALDTEDDLPPAPQIMEGVSYNFV